MVTPKSLIERDGGKAHYENMTLADYLKGKFENADG